MFTRHGEVWERKRKRGRVSEKEGESCIRFGTLYTAKRECVLCTSRSKVYRMRTHKFDDESERTYCTHLFFPLALSLSLSFSLALACVFVRAFRARCTKNFLSLLLVCLHSTAAAAAMVVAGSRLACSVHRSHSALSSPLSLFFFFLSLSSLPRG